MKCGDLIKVKIEDDNQNGNGIYHAEGLPIFVKGAKTNDEVLIKIVKLNKKYGVGEIKNYLKETNKEEIRCPYYETCGGCCLLHIPYERELKLKKEYIEKLFKRKNILITHFDRFNYRNKVTLHVKNGLLGFYKENSEMLIPIDKCPLLDNDINKLISYLKDKDLSKVSEILIRKGEKNLLLSFKGKLNSEDIELLKKYKNLSSIYQNDKLIYGDEYIKIKLNNVTYNINHNSFFQVNTKCASSLYEKTLKYAFKCEKLLDLYCGSASIGIYLKDISKEIVGIEINEDSVKCGLENIKENNVKNYKLIKEDAKNLKDSFDLVIVDPPRSGLDAKVIDKLNNMKIKKLIYISCNPGTLKRDANLLNNFNLDKIEVFNMFPATKHIECLCLFSKR